MDQNNEFHKAVDRTIYRKDDVHIACDAQSSQLLRSLTYAPCDFQKFLLYSP